MKRAISILLILVCLVSLCACGEKEAPAVSVPGVDAQSGAWIGQGGCFTAERARMPKGALAVGEYEGELYALTMGMESCTLYRGETEIKRIDGFVYDACAVKEGFWLNEDLYEDGRTSQKLSLLSFTGETIRQLTITPPSETAFPVLYTRLVLSGLITLEQLVTLMAISPRERFGIPMQNEYAIWDLSTEYSLDSSRFRSLGRSTPFEGWNVRGRCVLTAFNGTVVHSAEPFFD